MGDAMPNPDLALTLLLLGAVAAVTGVGVWSLDPVWPWQRRFRRWRMRRRFPAVMARMERRVRP